MKRFEPWGTPTFAIRSGGAEKGTPGVLQHFGECRLLGFIRIVFFEVFSRLSASEG